MNDLENQDLETLTDEKISSIWPDLPKKQLLFVTVEFFANMIVLRGDNGDRISVNKSAYILMLLYLRNRGIKIMFMITLVPYGYTDIVHQLTPLFYDYTTNKDDLILYIADASIIFIQIMFENLKNKNFENVTIYWNEITHDDLQFFSYVTKANIYYYVKNELTIFD